MADRMEQLWAETERQRKRISELEKENNELKAIIEFYDIERSSIFEAVDYLLPAIGWSSGGLAAAALEIVERLKNAQTNAARYEFLRKYGNISELYDNRGMMHSADTLDAVVDEMMSFFK